MTNLNELILQAKYSSEAMERLKHQYQPLIAARVMLHIGFWRPEYIEAGQAALEEAVMSYQSGKSSFTTHLRQVLRFRLIDLRRREKVDKSVPVSSLSEKTAYEPCQFRFHGSPFGGIRRPAPKGRN